MKKIVVISSVKNECDIIEYFCRYNLLYSDALLIHENHKSSDNTREIIEKLIEEGLPIFLEAEEDMYYETAKKELAKIAVGKYGADLVIQLDADEFLCLPNSERIKKAGDKKRQETMLDVWSGAGMSPIRFVLEKFEEDVEYQVPWRTYVYEKEPAAPAQFTPADFIHYRNPALEEAQGHAGKTIASRYLLTEKQAEYELGAHWLVYPEEQTSRLQDVEDTVKAEISKELVCAHYPIRSKEQVMRKAVLNFINKWTLPEQQRPTADELARFQLGILFNDIKKHGRISTDVMTKASITYSLFSYKADKERVDELLRDLGPELLIEGTLDTSLGGDKLTIQYAAVSEDENTFFRAYMNLLGAALKNIDAESRAKTQEIQDLLGELDAFSKERESLRAQIEDIYQSKSWKIGNKLVGAYRFFVRDKG